jgi:DNA modification methylase
MKQIKTISIKCETSEKLEIAEMTEMQGGLKERTDIDYDKIKLSICKFGFSFPFFIWKSGKTNYLIDGHGRFATLCKMQKDGYLIPPLPVVYIQCKNKTEAKQKLLRLNSQYGKMTKESVLTFAEDIDLNFDEIALPDTTIDFTDVTEPTETEGDDDIPDIDEKEKPNSERGCMYELGNSILMCGDSTNAEDVARLMGGEKADLVFTDPPYGMKKENEGVLNDNLNFDDLLEFNKKWIALSFEHLKDNASWYCWGVDEPLMDIYSNILKPMERENKITFRNLITWDKTNGQGQNAEEFRMYAVADEKCLFVMTGTQGFSNNADNYFENFEPIREYLKQERDRMNWTNADMKTFCGHSPTSGCHWFDKSQWMFPTEEEYKTWQKEAKGKGFKKEYEEIKKEYEEIKKEYEEIKKEWYSTRAYFDNTHDNMNNVWHFKRTSAEERKTTGGHATPKPLELCERAINTSSRKGELVLDFFGGSGSTLIASEKLGRKCRMIELDERYCDVIRRRYTQYAKLNGLKITSGCLD